VSPTPIQGIKGGNQTITQTCQKIHTVSSFHCCQDWFISRSLTKTKQYTCTFLFFKLCHKHWCIYATFMHLLQFLRNDEVLVFDLFCFNFLCLISGLQSNKRLLILNLHKNRVEHISMSFHWQRTTWQESIAAHW
jgi:hypothetical protein